MTQTAPPDRPMSADLCDHIPTEADRAADALVDAWKASRTRDSVRVLSARLEAERRARAHELFDAAIRREMGGAA